MLNMQLEYMDVGSRVLSNEKWRRGTSQNFETGFLVNRCINREADLVLDSEANHTRRR